MKMKTTPEKTNKKNSYLWGILLFFLLIFIDHLTKAVADIYFQMEGAPSSVPIIPDLIELCITYNRGISYGMGRNAPMEVKIAVVALTGVMMAGIAIAYFFVDTRRSFLRLAFVFIVAGGVGNLIDRVYYQVWDPATYNYNFRDGVRDMVDIHNLGFGVCNFADFFISAGAVMMALAFIFFDSYAMKPLGKYQELAAEAIAIEEQKLKEKEQRKIAKQEAKKSGGACSVACIGEVNADAAKQSDQEQTDEKEAK